MKINRNQPIARRIFGILIILVLVSGLFSTQGVYPANAQMPTVHAQPSVNIINLEAQFTPLISNSLFLYASTVLDFDTQIFLEQQSGPLREYSEEIDGQVWTAAESIEYNAVFYGINPQLILVILETQNHVVTQNDAQIPLRSNPSGELKEDSKFFYHIKWLSEVAVQVFNARRDGEDNGQVNFESGEIINIPLDLNAGTYGVQILLAELLPTDQWLTLVTGSYPLFKQIFFNWFGDPLVDPDAQEINVLALPSGYNLPFPVGHTWYFTGGPHTYTSSGNRPWSSVDFAPPEVTACSSGSTTYNASRWIVAAKGGNVITSQTALVVIDHGDGWRTYYSHVSTTDRRGTGGINQGDNLGHPSCQVEPGGSTSGIHVHFAIYQVGVGFVNISGSSLSGWSITETSHYNGTMTRQGVTRTATTGRHNGTNDIFNSGSSGGSLNPPSLQSPTAGQTLNNRSVNFTWQSPNATNQNGYTFRLNTSSSPDTQPWIVDTGLGNHVTSYSHTFSSDGTFYWHMRTWNTSGQASSWVTRSFNINTSGGGGSWAYQLFDLGDFNGDKYESNQTITNLTTVGWNDRAESIKINSGYEIVACEHDNFNGNCGRVTGPAQFADINALAQGLRNGVTSIRVCSGSCPTAPSAPSNPNPSSGSTLSRTNNTTLTWSTNGTSCQVFIQGGSINISPSGGCSSLALGQQRGGAYSWYVRSTNSYGTTTGLTWTFNIRPYGPSNLGASVVSASQINLNWTISSDDDGTNVDGYDIYRNGTFIASVNKGVSSYQSTGLACNTNYSYYVRSKRQGVQSDNSNTVNATTSACAPGTPTLNTPANNATVGRYDSVVLSWNSASGATQYYAEFWGDSGISVNSGWTSSLSYNVGNTFWGGTYQWRVKSRNSSNVESGWSEIRTLYRSYGSPTSLTALGASQSQINLSWGASADAPGNIQGYRIYRNGVEIQTVGSSTTSYSDTGVSCNTSYSYTVKAYKGTLESNASNTVNASPANCPPNSPSNLTVSGVTASSITLSWQDNSNNESGFKIYRWGHDGVDWGFYYLATVGANVTTYTQTNLSCGNDFNFYEITSYNNHGESVRVGWVQGETSACPPSDLQVTNISIDPLSARTNDNVYVYVEIANSSNTAASPFYLDLYIDKVPGSCPSTGDYWARINGLPANSSRTWTFEIPADTLTAGTHQIRTFADSFCEVTESNENNNISSPVSFTLTAPPAAPTHDDLNTARLISPLPYTNVVDVSGATRVSDDPTAASCNLRPGLASVWYLYTPTTNRTLTFDTQGSSYDTYIAVWTGTRGALTPVDCNDDTDGTLQSKVTVDLSANTTYYVQVAQWNGWLETGASGTSLENDPQLPPGAQSDEPGRPQSGRQPAYTDLMDALSDDKPRSDVDALAGGTLYFHAKIVSEIDVTISGAPMGTYALASGEERREYYNVSGGPVTVQSLNGMSIVSAIRLQSFANNTLHSFVETMGVPSGLLSRKYYFPTYNNTWTPLNSQVRFGNLDAGPTTIRVTIGGVNVWEQVVPGLEERRLTFPVSGGPVVIESLDAGRKIVAAIRLQSFAGDTLHSFSETMGIPNEYVSHKYYFPTYNNTWAPLNSQIRFGNLDASPTTVRVTIGGVNVWEQVVPGLEERRLNFPVSGGPVVIESLDAGKKIVAAIRLQSFAGDTLHSFVETMGVPEGLLSHKYYFPTYNNTWAPLNSQVRFGNLSATTTRIRVTIGGVNVWEQDVPGLEERRLNFSVSGGPVIVESLDTSKKIVVAIRLQSYANNILYSFSETMGIPAAFLSDTYYFPTYNNTWPSLNSQLRFGVP